MLWVSEWINGSKGVTKGTSGNLEALTIGGKTGPGSGFALPLSLTPHIHTFSLSFIICLSSNVLLDFLSLFICEIEPLKRSAGSPHSHG